MTQDLFVFHSKTKQTIKALTEFNTPPITVLSPGEYKRNLIQQFYRLPYPAVVLPRCQNNICKISFLNKCWFSIV